MTDGGTSDNIDAGLFVTNVDGLRVYQLYNSLYAFDKNAVPQLSLAEEVTPNVDSDALDRASPQRCDLPQR